MQMLENLEDLDLLMPGDLINIRTYFGEDFDDFRTSVHGKNVFYYNKNGDTLEFIKLKEEKPHFGGITRYLINRKEIMGKIDKRFRIARILPPGVLGIYCQNIFNPILSPDYSDESEFKVRYDFLKERGLI